MRFYSVTICERIRIPLVTTNAFERIAIITDRDDRAVADICTSLSENMGGFFTDIQDREWCENPYDKNIVDKTAEFVQQMRTEADKYISTERLQLKAHLGVTWAVQFPGKVFSMIDEQINSVRWEEYDTLKECFGILIEI